MASRDLIVVGASRYREDLMEMERNIDILTRLLSDERVGGRTGEGNGSGG